MLSGAIFVKNPSGSRAMRRAAKKHSNPHRGSKRRGHKARVASARSNPKRGARGRFMKSNPRKAKRYVRRRNPDMAGGMLDKVMSPVQGLVRKVPFLGPRVAPLLVPITFGLVGSAGLFYGMKLVGGYVPASVKPFAYTIGGAVLALGSAILPIAPKSKVGLAVAFAGIGASLDLFRHYSGTSADLSGDMDELSGDMDEDDDMDGLVTDTAGGLMVDMDGIVTDTAGLVVDTGALSSSAAVDSMAGAVMGNYEDATLGDANAAPDDMDEQERQAAAGGPSLWARTFGQTPRMHRLPPRPYSRHAGRAGHRFGWLYKLLGPAGMQQLAKIPTEKRVQVIQTLKANAIQQVQKEAMIQAGPAAGQTGNLYDTASMSGAYGGIAAGSAY